MCNQKLDYNDQYNCLQKYKLRTFKSDCRVEETFHAF